MHGYRAVFSALFIFALAAAALPPEADASTSGLAWDSVMKFEMNADQSSLQPGNFDDDFAAASAVQTPEQHGGGIFSQIRSAMAQGQGVQGMMQSGVAEHHYIAGSKERTDHISSQTATIVDCAARTITTLDLRDKTYKIVSMDQPAPPKSSGGEYAPRPNATDSDLHVAISVTNTPLGARAVGGQPSTGYRSVMTMTETGSSGSRTQNGDLLAYYSNLDDPVPVCSAAVPIGAPRMGATMGGYARVMQALSGAGGSRFSVTQSGPRLPIGKLAMFEALTFGMQGQGATIVTERGNVRPIDASDPAFGIPAGFTQTQ
jgi:hypothetical protein